MEKLVHEEQITIAGEIDAVVHKAAAAFGEVAQRDGEADWRFGTGSRAAYSIWGAYFQPAAVPLEVQVTTRNQPDGVILVTVLDKALGLYMTQGHRRAFLARATEIGDQLRARGNS